MRSWQEADREANAGLVQEAGGSQTRTDAAKAPRGCQGDGSPTQNPSCASMTSRSGCAWTPGCNWEGESHFGGWCAGPSTCVYMSGRASCASGSGTGCRWIPGKAVNMDAERAADAADGQAAMRS